MKRIKLLFAIPLFLGVPIFSHAQQNITNYIKVYFNQPVDTIFSNGINAQYVKNAIFDTIVSYINRAKYTVDIAQYDYTASLGDTVSHIAKAINNAYGRGVKIRWIYDGSSPNSGLSLLNSNIPTLASPDGGGCYNNNSGIMHNKFVIIDAWDSLHAWVSTGSEDWNIWMNDYDYNNLLFIQSMALAKAYTNEFNIMWGDTIHGEAPLFGNELFGICKPNSGMHLFMIGGSGVELYFSPSDAVNTHVISSINSADTDMYLSMYDFTESIYSTPFVNRHNAGVYTSSILDQYSSGYGSYNALAALPNFVEYTGREIYHDKFVTIDPSDACSDPIVLTGSMNWTYGGYSENDENTIIIHNDTIANLYLQEYAGNYKVISGGKHLTKHYGCSNLSGLNDLGEYISGIEIYPNPSYEGTTIKYTLSKEENITIELFNMVGQKVNVIVTGEKQSVGVHSYHIQCPVGVSILKMKEGQQIFVKKIVRIY